MTGIKTNLYMPCPKCEAEDGLIWHPKPNVGWYCHECGEGFEGLPDLHEILKAVDQMLNCDGMVEVTAAMDQVFRVCKTRDELGRRGKV